MITQLTDNARNVDPAGQHAHAAKVLLNIVIAPGSEREFIKAVLVLELA